MPGWQAWQTADAVRTLIRAAPLHPLRRRTSCPRNLPFSINHYLQFAWQLISIAVLLTAYCDSRRLEALCLVCRVLRTYSLPPALGVVCVSLIPTCPRICVCSIYSMALVASRGVLRMVLRLCRPERLAKMRFRRSLCWLQWRRTWATVCRLSPQLQPGLVMSGTCRLKRKSLRPIFSVRSCASSALSRLLSLSWSCSTFLVGTGVCLYVARPFFSSLHALTHALSACVLHHLLSVVLSGYSCGGGSAGCCLRPSSLHPVASLAAWSAASFPGMPTWAGIHRTVTEYPLSWSSRTCRAMSARM
jgi:hypothetical protein